MGRPARIDRAAILDAAMAIADQDGLAAVSLHAVARRLGVTAMALYRHLDGKEALLDGLVERLLTAVPVPAHGSWEQRLVAMAGAIREVARRHPAAFPLLLSRPAVTPAAQRTRTAVVAALRESGLPEAAAVQTERLLSSAVLGFASSEASGRFRQHDPATLDEDFGQLLSWLRLALADQGAAARTWGSNGG